MLAELQQQLSDIYQVESDHDVRDYLITDPTLAQLIGQDAMLRNTEETLLVSQDDDELLLSLFLDGEMLQRLESANPLHRLRAGQLDDLWKVLEGVSHFNCVTWKAGQDRTVTLLELELQGEIDKFVATALLALAQADNELLDRLHSWLFDDVRFHSDLDESQIDRYRAANDYAARFCHRIREQLCRNDMAAFAELRQFYRLQAEDKISHIHSRSWSPA